jgi:PAT family beta-lactamase induction signal transducer AmpG
MTAPDRDADRVPMGYLALFASLYAVQGVVVAYITNFNTNYMTAKGQSLDRAAVAETIALLPLALKFLVGPLSDRVNLFGLGHRLPYIVLGVVVQSLGLAGLAMIDPGQHLLAFGGMALLTVLGLALYDTCCDGMVLDVTPPSRRAGVQGLLWVSRFAATTVCTFGFGRWLGRPGVGQEGIPMVLWACAALGLVPLLLSRGATERPRAADAERFSWAALGCLARPWTLALLLYGGLYAMVALGAEFKLAAFYKALGYGEGAIGDLGSVRFLGRAVGALLLPLSASVMGQRARMVVGLCGLVASTAGQATISGPLSAGGFAFLFGMANGWSDALFGVLAMQGSDPRLAASTFALIMAVSNLSVVGNAAFAALATALGSFRQAYLIAAVAIVPLLVLAIPLGRPGPNAHAGDDAP